MARPRPALRAFAVIKREGQDDFWLPIGAAFVNQNSSGFDVILQALPAPSGDGQYKLVLSPCMGNENDRKLIERSARNNKTGSRRR